MNLHDLTPKPCPITATPPRFWRNDVLTAAITPQDIYDVMERLRERPVRWGDPVQFVRFEDWYRNALP